MKSLEYTKFATVTIVIAQLLAGLIGAVSVVLGVIRLFEDFFQGLMTIANGIVFLGIFFALARVRNLGDTEGND